MPPKRQASQVFGSSSKKPKLNAKLPNMYYRIATFENASRVSDDPPVARLQAAVRAAASDEEPVGSSVVYWMRMEDLRSKTQILLFFQSKTDNLHPVDDNRALSAASTLAKRHNVPLLTMFIFSPQDYVAHDRGARRIDFTIRNLADLWSKLDNLNIPLVTLSHASRKTLPEKVIELLEQWGSKNLFANAGETISISILCTKLTAPYIEYEVDEIRRDIQVLQNAQSKGINAHFLADKLIVEPNSFLSQSGKPYAVCRSHIFAYLKSHSSDRYTLLGFVLGKHS